MCRLRRASDVTQMHIDQIPIRIRNKLNETALRIEENQDNQ